MSILDILFPVSCLECGKEGKYICDNCIKKVEVICRFNPSTNTFSIFKYNGVVRKAIIALKYKFATDVSEELVDICTNKLKNNLPITKAVLIPIPLHTKRQNWRGFNQSEILGKLIAEKMSWKFEPNLLMRTLASKPQVGLTKSERVRNISGKFAVNDEALRVILSDGELVEPESNRSSPNFVIFDDVLTTGSTLQEAMKVLQKAIPACPPLAEASRRITGLTIAK